MLLDSVESLLAAMRCCIMSILTAAPLLQCHMFEFPHAAMCRELVEDDRYDLRYAVQQHSHVELASALGVSPTRRGGHNRVPRRRQKAKAAAPLAGVSTISGGSGTANRPDIGVSTSSSTHEQQSAGAVSGGSDALLAERAAHEPAASHPQTADDSCADAACQQAWHRDMGGCG